MKQLSPLKKHIDESPKLRELKRRRHMRRMRLLALFGTLAVVVIAGAVYVAHIPKLQIVTVEVSGNQVIDTDEVIARVDTMLTGSYLYAIPRRMALFYPKADIEAYLVATFPRFENVTVYRTDLHTLRVEVEEVRGRSLWCGSDVLTLRYDAPCYFTDQTGKIVDLAPHYSGNVYPRFFGGSLSDNDVDPLGERFVTEAQFGDLLLLHRAVEGLGFQIKAIKVGPGDENAFVLDLGVGHTALVRFLGTDDFAVLTSNFSAALGKAELSAELKKNKVNLEYFDLRFTNKVYYKFSN